MKKSLSIVGVTICARITMIIIINAMIIACYVFVPGFSSVLA